MGVAVFWHFFALMPGLSSHLPPPGAYSKRKQHLPKMLAVLNEKVRNMILAINNRRSIRKFLDKPISQDDITEIIQSGIKAPSSKNRQPWKFIVVQEYEKEEMLNAFRRGNFQGRTRNSITSGKQAVH